MDNEEEYVTSSWMHGLNDQMANDPLMFIVLTHLMALTIRKTLSEEEITRFVDQVLRKIRREILGQYKQDEKNNLIPQILPDMKDHEEFMIGLDQQLKETASKLRKFLVRKDE